MQFKVTYHVGGKRKFDSAEKQSEGIERFSALRRESGAGDDRGVCETVRDVIENLRENAHTCTEVKNSTRETITLCVQDKERSAAEGTWRGRTEQVPAGEVIHVNGQREDIEGMVHSDGSVTKFKGIACKGWTEEHSAAWLREKWPDCGGAQGRTQKPGMLIQGLEDSSIYSFARVDSAHPGWHEGRALAANHAYRIIPRSSDRWTLNRGVTFDDFTGGGVMDGNEIGVPKADLRLGGLAVLVWHHLEDGSAAPQIIDFSPGQNAAEFSIGAWGGSIHFLIADRAGCWGDNFGDCIVAMAML